MSRDEFEKRKDFVEKIIEDLGGIRIVDPRTYGTTTSHFKGNEETWMSQRPVFGYNNRYYRVNEILFERPFVVIECADTWEEVLNFQMEDAEPFPHDLPDNIIIKEVRCALEIDPYPASYPEWDD